MKYGFVLVAALAALTGACATGAKVENMTVSSTGAREPADPSLKNAMCVHNVAGGKETSPLWVSQVDDASFKTALENSLRDHGLHAASADDCAYDINVNLLGLNQPSFGFSFTVTAHTNYEVNKDGSGDLYYSDSISTPFTATMSDSALGVERLRIANEGAVRENISTFINNLLDFTPAQ